MNKKFKGFTAEDEAKFTDKVDFETMNWDDVESAFALGMTTIEVAAMLGIQRSTLYLKIKKKYGVSPKNLKINKKMRLKKMVLENALQMAMDGDSAIMKLFLDAFGMSQRKFIEFKGDAALPNNKETNVHFYLPEKNEPIQDEQLE